MRFFGPSTKEIWRQLSEQLGGELVSSWRGNKVRVAHDDWVVTLDTYVVMAGKTPIVFTRMRAPYVNPSGFRFSISRRNFFAGLTTWFGAQDIEIGDPAFDHAFVVKGNDEAKVRELFNDPQLRQLATVQSSIALKVVDDEGWFGASFTEDVDELYFSVPGVIKDIDRLKRLYELFAHTLDRLVRLGAADPAAPSVQL